MKNERKKAVALGYNPEKQVAPKVLAKGKGLIADKIIKIAAEEGIPSVKNSVLANGLMAVEIDKEIPPDMFVIAAEVFAFVYSLEQAFYNKLKDKDLQNKKS